MKKPQSMQEFTELMHNLSGALMLFGQTLISAFFVIVILGLVLFVEIQRVAHGIQLFEASEQLAYLGAFVLVMMLLTLEFVVHYVETKHGYHDDLKTNFSLRLFGQWLQYVIGWGDEWEARHKSPAHEIKSYSNLLIATILALAVAGSMSSAISEIDGNWMQGVQAIATQSTLAELIEWIGGLLFALALVVGTQRLTSYVAQRASETLVSSDKPKQTIKHDIGINQQDIAIVSINPDMASWIVDPDSLHDITCPDCGKEFTGYDTERKAQLALQAHKRHCDVSVNIERLQVVNND